MTRDKITSAIIPIAIGLALLLCARQIISSRPAMASYPEQEAATTPLNCANPIHRDTTIDGGTAANTPSIQLQNRRFGTWCNSGENSGSPTVKCRIDGATPVMGVGNPGDVLAIGSCVSYNISDGITVQCAASTTGVHVTTLECR